MLTLYRSYIFVALGVFLLPLAAYAQGLEGVLSTISGILDPLVPILITLALVYFFWGLIQYILKADSPEGRSAARQIMLHGIIALFVMVSVWGLVALLQETFDVQETTIQAPTVPGS